MCRLESKTANGLALWIEIDGQGFHRLDCEWSGRGGKHYHQLPRCYRTERGAKQGAALLTGERLVWAPQASASTTN